MWEKPKKKNPRELRNKNLAMRWLIELITPPVWLAQSLDLLTRKFLPKSHLSLNPVLVTRHFPINSKRIKNFAAWCKRISSIQPSTANLHEIRITSDIRKCLLFNATRWMFAVHKSRNASRVYQITVTSRCVQIAINCVRRRNAARVIYGDKKCAP